MNPIELPFGEWLPDQATYRNPGLVTAENCYAVASGYSPFNGVILGDDTTTEPVAGAALYFKNDDSGAVVGGSSTRLFVLDGSGVTETTSYTALGSSHRWRFERFNDMIFAVTPNNTPQTLSDIDNDTSWANLGGSPPKAAVVGRVNDFLMMGDLTDIDTSTQPSRVRWSALNNPGGNWVTDRGELSDFRTLDPRFGRVTGIVSGRVGLVFQERAIYRVTFVGAPLVFDFERISEARGCIAPDSIVRRGWEVYFLSHDGFAVTNGSSVELVGAQRVTKHFADDRDDALVSTVQGAINWNRQSIVWNYIPKTSSGYTRQIIYNFEIGRWTTASLMNHWLVQAKIDGTTLSDLASAYPGGIGDIPEPLGSPAYLPRGLSFSAFVESGDGSSYGGLTGDALEATFATGDSQVQPGRRTTALGVYPLVETVGEVRTQVVARERQGGPGVSTAEMTREVDGWHSHRADGLFLALRVKIPEGEVWDNMTGAMVRVRSSGAR